MEQAQLLTRQRSSDDERSVEIHSTEQGWQHKPLLACSPQHFIDQSDFDLDYACQLKGLLDHLNNYIAWANSICCAL